LSGAVELVGRTNELAELRALLADNEQPRSPRAALVLAEAGLGKTRLLAEATAQVAGRRVFRLVGFEPERHVPLGAAAELIRELTGYGAEGERLEALLGSADPIQGGLEPLRVFEAAYRTISRLGDVLIVIDDAQWLDELSRALVHYLLRAAHANDETLLMLCAARPTAVSTAFAASVRRLFADSDGYVELSLSPLDRADGMRLAQLMQPALADDRAGRISAMAGGSPFWIELTARSGEAGGPSAAISGMLRALSVEAVSCLAALVVAARPADANELAEVLGWRPMRVGAALTELVNRGVVSPYAGSFRTAHDLVREAALNQIPAEELTRLHCRFGEVLGRRAAGDLQLSMEALEHESAAGMVSLTLALEIACSPQRRLLGQSGFARLVAAADAPSADNVRTMALKVELAHLADELGDHEAALDRWTVLSDELEKASDRTAAALTGARHGLELGRSSEMTALLDRARAGGGADPWTNVAAHALDYNRLVWLDHDSAGAKPHLQAAISTARELLAEAGSVEALDGPARIAYVEAVDAERVARLMDDDIVEMLAVSDEMTEATRGLGERHLDARLSACMSLRFLNRWQECETRLTAAVDEARQQVYPGVAAYGTYELAIAAYNLGRIADAEQLHAQARQLGERIDTAFEVADTWLCGLRQLIDASANDWQAAIASLREEIDRQPNPHCRLILRQRAAMCAARFGGPDWRDLVVELIDAADTDAAAADCVRCLWELRLVAAELHARIGDEQRASELLTCWDVAHPAPHPRALFMRARTGAVLAAVSGSDDAADMLRNVREAAATAGARLDEVWTLLDLADVLASSDRTGAIDALTTAAHLAADLGAASEGALAKRKLRALGVRTVSRQPRTTADGSPLANLTSRELDVARLAMRGTRNTAIAESLFISAKTVEQHLSRIFAKLGVRNRAELGSRYADQLGAGTDAAKR
jgi:DNA-binding NarL/FixJ family response regulator